jgi:hypothetical protein
LFRLIGSRAAATLKRFDRPASFDALAYLKQSIATLPAPTGRGRPRDGPTAAQRKMISDVPEWTGDGVLLRSSR